MNGGIGGGGQRTPLFGLKKTDFLEPQVCGACRGIVGAHAVVELLLGQAQKAFPAASGALRSPSTAVVLGMVLH